MKIGVLTSSRADYGIYLPLLQKLQADSFFKLEIIAFGTHTSRFHGYTLAEINQGNYQKIHTVSSILTDDDEHAISTTYGLTVLKFAEFWTFNRYDLVFCLGDRFEMSAAIQAGVPFGVRFAHIHGGETTLGAIDNIYRHQITLASKLHFTSADIHSKRVAAITGNNENIFTVGSLSIDGIKEYSPIPQQDFYNKFSIPETKFALVTFHPETVSVESNAFFAEQMKLALTEIATTIFLVISMPNADTLGTEYRAKLQLLKLENPGTILLIESFGKVNYFSAMHYAQILIGNTSSGIIEAASFGKYVVNVGNRQKGRAKSGNVIDAAFSASDIVAKTASALAAGVYSKGNIYYKQGTAQHIVDIIKQNEKL